MVVSGSDDQKIRLFKFPVNIPKQKSKEYIGHSSHVTRVRFSNDEGYLLSVGGNDRTTILWEVKGPNKPKKPQPQPEEEQEEENVSEVEDMQESDYEQAQQIRVPKLPEEKKKIVAAQKDDFDEDDDEGDQFMAIKPWKGAIKEPTNPYYKSTGKAPPVKLELQYAHGYRTKDCRSNLRYVDENLIAYHTAGLGILMSTENKQQTFFDAHNDDVISFYQHKNNRSILYSSQMGAKPSVFAWNSQGQKIKEFKGAQKGVSAVLGNEKYVVAACLDDDHYIFVWNYKTGAKLKSEKGGKDVIISMEWVGEDSFVTIGVKHYKFWNVNTLKGQSGSFGKNSNDIRSIAVKSQKIFVGAADGCLQVWGGKSCNKSIKVHQKSPINALWCGQEIILTGASDKTIKILNLQSLATLTTINCDQIIKDSVSLSIRSLDVWKNKILVGTFGSEIYEIKSSDAIQNANEGTKFSLSCKLMSGHYAPNVKTLNEVWGLALYDNNKYVTCSEDGTARIWDIAQKQQQDRFSLNFDKSAIEGGKKKGQKNEVKPKTAALPESAKGRCLCVSEQKWIVIGCKDGTLKIVDQNLTPRYCGLVNNKKKEISQVKFSPDYRLLAVGDHLGFISVYEWNGGNIKLKHKKIKHGSAIKHFDFSKDSNTIHSTCIGYELLFWQAETGKQKTSGATETRNEQWATWNVTLGWPVQGVFEAYMDGTDVNAVDRSNQEHCKPMMKLLASGDDNGKVRLLEYPCVVQNSQSQKGKGHSSHVTNVKFTSNDEMIISTGGEDQTILQWKWTAK